MAISKKNLLCRILSCGLLCLIAFSSWSQISQLDSLETLLRTSITDSTKIAIYRQVIWPKTRSAPEEARLLTDSLMSLGMRTGNKKAQLLATYYYGTTYKNQGKFPEALRYFKRYADYYQEKMDTVQLTNVMYQLAVVYIGMGDFEKSMSYYNQCIAFDRILNRPNSLATTISSRASLFRQLDQFDRAIKDQMEALALFQSVDNTMGIASCQLNLGNIYIDKGDLKEGLEYYDLAEVTASEEKNEYMLAIIFESRGNAFVKNNDYQSALQAYITSLDLRTKLGRIQDQASTQNKIADLYLKTGQYSQAIDLSVKALNKATSQDVLSQVEAAHRNLAHAYRHLGKYEEAFQHHELFAKTRDSILNLNITKQIAEMDARFEATQKQNEIDRLSLEAELQESRLKLQGTILISVLVIFAILIVLTKNIYLQSRRIEKQKDRIEKSLREKDFLLKEIHHRVKNNLQVISSLLKLQSREITDKSAQLALDEGRNRVRSMALIHQNLYQKDNLTGIKMRDYIKQLAQELIDTYRIDITKVNLNLDIDDINLDVDSAIPIGLIINELMTNSMKYAFSNNSRGEISIALSQESGVLLLQVGDDGKGFDPNQNSSNTFGQRLISAFAERLRADYSLTTDDGTQATFQIRDFKLAA